MLIFKSSVSFELSSDKHQFFFCLVSINPFSSSESYRKFYAMTIFKEFNRLIHFHTKIIISDPILNLSLFHVFGFLLFFLFFVFLSLIVHVLPIIYHLYSGDHFVFVVTQLNKI